MSDVEILYTAWNRLQFVGLSWHLLMINTDWDHVSKLTVYDDGSEDGTLEMLREHMSDCPVEVELRETDLRAPAAIMNHFFAEKRATYVAKIDSDICCPPRWLHELRALMEQQPKLMLLGSEAGQTYSPNGSQPKVVRCSHIGGVGLMRTHAFTHNPVIPARVPSGGAGGPRAYFGFTEWQIRYQIPRGWYAPDLMMPQIDRIPVEPWRTYTEEYVERGWCRDWGPYPKERVEWWNWIEQCR